MGLRIYFFLILLIIAVSCRTDASADLMEIDRDFSRRSTETGMKQAFLEFADDSAVMLQKNSMPLVGKTAIMNSFTTFTDTEFVLTWEPLSGDISRAGDLGYTYGLYILQRKADSSIVRGKYVSIWKKQADGSWKYVLDAGNEGL